MSRSRFTNEIDTEKHEYGDTRVYRGGKTDARVPRICKFNNANLVWVHGVVQDSLHVLAVHYACVLCAPVAPNQGSPLLRKPNAA